MVERRALPPSRLAAAPTLFLALVLAPSSIEAAPPGAPGPSDPIDFGSTIRPILARHCFACHGPDPAARERDLRLDDLASATREREAGLHAITPHEPARSEILRRLRSADAVDRMPPPEARSRPSEDEIALLERWITEGASYERPWAFAAPQKRTAAKTPFDGLARNDVDRHVFAALALRGLSPSAEADRATLARRVALDLTGLPPTPDEVRAFEEDASEDAYERLVDRALAHPGYGERMARLWLDLARYADSAGFGSDPLRTIWPWRDWVIDAFDANMPYDRFLVEQLAGDLLPSPTRDQRLATAFHRNTLTNTEGGTDDEEFRVAAVKDRVDVTLQAFMGLTVGCAQCHAHKFDPIGHDEYYRLYAFFDQTEDADRPDEAPRLATPRREDLAAVARLEAEIATLAARAQSTGGEDVLPALESARAALAPLLAVTTPVLAELPAERRRTTRVLGKGDFLDPREVVLPGVPASLHPFPAGAPHDRLGLARWIVAPDNPLTARVLVNRVWAMLFGAGIVRTEEDFGAQGDPPTHPDLLDALAVDFVAGGYDVKRLLRTIVASHVYRQRSDASPALRAADPDNRWLARGARFRVDGEIVRDQALAISGLLSPKKHGPPVYPPQPDGLWRAAFNGERSYVPSEGEDRRRRAIYTVWRRTVPHPSLAAFDLPSRETCTLRRPRTNTPLQALVTLNDPAHVECAQALGRRLLNEGGATDAERCAFGLRLTLLREPGAAEVAALVRLVAAARAAYAGRAADALALATLPLGPLPDGMDPVEAAASTLLANVLLNQDAFLTRE